MQSKGISPGNATLVFWTLIKSYVVSGGWMADVWHKVLKRCWCPMRFGTSFWMDLWFGFSSYQLRVTWNNPESFFRQDVEVVEDIENILETISAKSKYTIKRALRNALLRKDQYNNVQEMLSITTWRSYFIYTSSSSIFWFLS